jgi:hypothetical protein
MYQDDLAHLFCVISHGDIYELLGRTADVIRSGRLLGMAECDIDAAIMATLARIPEHERFRAAIDPRVPAKNRTNIVAVDRGGLMLERVGIANFRVRDPAERFIYKLEWAAPDGSCVVQTSEMIYEREIESERQ